MFADNPKVVRIMPITTVMNTNTIIVDNILIKK